MDLKSNGVEFIGISPMGEFVTCQIPGKPDSAGNNGMTKGAFGCYPRARPAGQVSEISFWGWDIWYHVALFR